MSGYVGEKAGAFAAFLFLILAIGIFIGYMVMARWPDMILYAIIAPVVIGLAAYFNRALAVLLFFFAVAFILLVA